MRIALLAGETSGDVLGARLIKSLSKIYPDAVFEGIAGQEMQSAGCQSLFPMERLSIMGIIEVAPRYLELRNARNKLIQRWLDDPPDLFVGIDAPDFNLYLEKKLYQAGIPTVHYVSPNVWAWRQGRLKKMINAMDLMLTLFPFEVDFYKKHAIRAQFVGHPLADEIPLDADKQSAREKLGLVRDGHILAVLPGSRMGEIKHLADDFLKALNTLHQKHPDWLFVIPLVNDAIRRAFTQYKQRIAPDLPVTLVEGQSRIVMQASDQILLASGTAVLEGMLVNRPMVAAYRISALSVAIIRFFRMIKSKYFTLPNNLLNEYLVPELIQEQLTEKNIVSEIEKQFNETQQQRAYRETRFDEMHHQLRQNASEKAAIALRDLLETKRKTNKREQQG